MCEIKSLDFEGLSKATVRDYWKILEKLSKKDSYVRILHNGLILCSKGQDLNISLYNPFCLHPIVENVEFAYFLMNGYGVIGTTDGKVYLFGPKGKLKMTFSYNKSYYTTVIETKEKGVINCCSGYLLTTKFLFTNNTIAIRCQNKCYIAKVNKLDLKKLFYVGLYDDILEMKDNCEGLVYVLYKNGKIKVFDDNFKEVSLVDGARKVVFLENGDFFVFTLRSSYLYDKKANLIGERKGASAFYGDRFYQIGEEVFDCFTHKVSDKEIVPLYKKGNDILYFEKGKVFYNRTFKTHGFNKLMFRDALFNLSKKPYVINKKFLAFECDGKQFVIDLWKSDVEIKKSLADFIEKETDLKIETFDYFREFCSHLKREKISLKGILYKELI